MGQLIDLKTKTKLNDAPSYEQRTIQCIETEDVQGSECRCSYCLYKRKLTEELLATASQAMVAQMQKTKDPYFLADLHDVFALACKYLENK
jgi:hypothetical protein